jgi:oligogalacturonide transporter
VVGGAATSGWIWIGMGLVGLGAGRLNYIPWATYNYMADVDEIVTGRRREGVRGRDDLYPQGDAAAAVALVGLLMDAGGFVPKADVQSHGAVLTWFWSWAWHMGDAGLWHVDLARFRLSRATHGVLMGEIEHLRGGGRDPTSETAREVVRGPDRLGIRRLWGNNPVGGKL